MKFHVEETLPNLVQDGALTLYKIYTEIVTETKRKAKETKILGELIITREVKLLESRSEITIKDRFPIDITVPNNKKVIEKADVDLTMHNLNFSFGVEGTKFSAEIELINVDEKVGQLA